MQHHEQQSPEVAAWLDEVQLHEAPYGFTRWVALMCASAQAQRNVYLPYMGNALYANMYSLIVGPPAGRKSTVVERGKRLLEAAGHANFCPVDITKSSLLKSLKQGDYRSIQAKRRNVKTSVAGFGALSASATDELLDEGWDLDAELAASDNSQSESPMTIWAGELQTLFPPQSDDILPILQQLWDSPDNFETRTGMVYNPYITICAAVNTETLPVVFKKQSLLTGLLSRMIFIYEPPSGRSFDPFSLPVGHTNSDKAMIELLQDIEQMEGAMGITEDAKRFVLTLSNIPREIVVADHRLEFYADRRQVHLLKMGMNQALLNRRMEITLEDMRYVHTLLCFSESHMPEALGEYGYSRDGHISQAVLTHLGRNPAGLTPAQLFAKISHYVNDVDSLITQLRLLETMKLIKKQGVEADPDKTIYIRAMADLGKWSAFFDKVIFPSYLEEWEARLGAFDDSYQQ